MHALLASAYHLALLPWLRPVAAALLGALLLRGLGLAPALAAAGAGLAGWLVLGFPYSVWPLPPPSRLPGLALIVLADAGARAGPKRAAAWWVLPVTAAAAAWWLRGAPLEGAALVNCVPVFLGFAFAFPLVRRLARADTGWGSLGAALALAGGLMVSAASVRWIAASLVPAAVALALLGMRDAMPGLAGLLVAAAISAIVASDRGRLVPVDIACLVPLLAWPLAARLTPRLSASGPALAGLLAAASCVALAWLAAHALAAR
jgi:hypothetical protein